MSSITPVPTTSSTSSSYSRYNFPNFKNNQLNTDLFDCTLDWPSTLEAFCCPTSLVFRLEFALYLDRKVQTFAKKRLGGETFKKQNPREYYRQLENFASHVYERLELHSDNADLFNGFCHFFASTMTLPCAPCVVGVFVDKEDYHFEQLYADEETGENTWEKRGPKQERDDDSMRSLLACFCSPCHVARLYREVIIRGMLIPSLKLERMEMRTLTGGDQKGRRKVTTISNDDDEDFVDMREVMRNTTDDNNIDETSAVAGMPLPPQVREMGEGNENQEEEKDSGTTTISYLQ